MSAEEIAEDLGRSLMVAKPYVQTTLLIDLAAEDLRTWANGVTLLRTVGGLIFFLLTTGSPRAALSVLAGLYSVNIYSFVRLERLIFQSRKVNRF